MDRSRDAPRFDDYVLAQSIVSDARSALQFTTLAIPDGGTPLARAIVELSAALNLPTIAGAASADEQDRLASAGATHIIRRDKADFAEELKLFTDGRGADAVVDQAAGADFSRSFDLVADFGDILITGWTGGDAPNLFETMWAQLDHCPCIQIWTLDRYASKPGRLRQIDQEVRTFLADRPNPLSVTGA
jgi:NADPH:quinone reductase-like Zn-dependent oxidoreductase